MKTARRGETAIAVAEKYCERLVRSLETLHLRVKDKVMADRRRKALRAARHGPGL